MRFKWWTAYFALCVANALLALFTGILQVILCNWFGGIGAGIILLICVFIAAGISGRMEDEI
jgi:hypothetical protein